MISNWKTEDNKNAKAIESEGKNVKYYELQHKSEKVTNNYFWSGVPS